MHGRVLGKIKSNSIAARKRQRGPGRRTGGQDGHTERRHRGKKRGDTLGERERGQSGRGGLDVVDGRIAIRRWQSGSRCSMQAQRRLESFPQPPRHWMNGGLRCRTVGNRTRTPGVLRFGLRVMG